MQSIDILSCWLTIYRVLEQTTSRVVLNSWLNNLVPYPDHDGYLCLAAPNQTLRRFIAPYVPEIKKIHSRLFPEHPALGDLVLEDEIRSSMGLPYINPALKKSGYYPVPLDTDEDYAAIAHWMYYRWKEERERLAHTPILDSLPDWHFAPAQYQLPSSERPSKAQKQVDYAQDRRDAYDEKQRFAHQQKTDFAKLQAPVATSSSGSDASSNQEGTAHMPNPSAQTRATSSFHQTDITLQAQGYNSSRIDPSMTFDNFIVGTGNRFAHAACEAVAKKQGNRNYNPLFIYGGSGLGKTHLLMAIGNYVLKEHPDRRMIYVQCEQIVNEFVAASRNNRYDEFRQRYRSCDLLLIDDIQLLTGKDRTKEEFFNTFNALFVNDRNIVMTCDKPPQSLTAIEERLVTRFSSGLIVDIQTPDYETRLAILEHLAEEANFKLSFDIADYIANNIVSSVREMEGAFKTIMAYATLAGEEKFDLNLARLALKDIISPAHNRKVSHEMIIEIVARYYGRQASELLSDKRSRNISDPRKVALYLCREVLGASYEQIGQFFANRHYSTVMYNCDCVSKELARDPHGQLAEDISKLRRRIES